MSKRWDKNIILKCSVGHKYRETSRVKSTWKGRMPWRRFFCWVKCLYCLSVYIEVRSFMVFNDIYLFVSICTTAYCFWIAYNLFLRVDGGVLQVSLFKQKTRAHRYPLPIIFYKWIMITVTLHVISSRVLDTFSHI